MTLLRRFTLIELLVVIAIISVLAAMLLPSLQLARRKARLVVCKSQLRQVNLGLTTYTADHDGWWPWRWGVSATTPDDSMVNGCTTEVGSKVWRDDARPNRWSNYPCSAKSFDFHSEIEFYIPPSAVYQCPMVQGKWQDGWEVTKNHQFRGYDVMAGYVKNTNWWMAPQLGNSGAYIGSSWEGSMKYVFPLKIGDLPNNPIAGDHVEGQDTTGVKRLLGSHMETGIEGVAPRWWTFPNYTTVTIPEHNFVYSDGHVAATGTKLYPYMAFSNGKENHLYWRVEGYE